MRPLRIQISSPVHRRFPSPLFVARSWPQPPRATGKWLVLAILFVVFLTGCTLRPEYNRPGPPVAGAWPTGAAYGEAQAEGVAPSALPWQEFFADPSLKALIGMALRQNRDLRL
ncbi:MAG: hypothetical protein FWE89_01595, partial [Syntrophaceae bacterium]|nr:hypothetical protein [Syntrophaceae bacterium]